MIWINILVSVFVSAAVCAVFARLWRRRIRREMETDAIIGNLRKEVGDMVTELNGTTERNIALLENRISHLNAILDKAGKTTGVLKRESEKHDLASQVYTSLERSRPINSLNLSVVDSGVDEKDSGAEVSQDKSSEDDGSSDKFRPEQDVVDFSSMSPRDRALVLYRRGEGFDSIANQLGMSRGEVELIISLHERRPQ